MIRIIHTEDHDDEIAACDRVCFADGSAYPVELVPSAECWVALDGDEVVGYAVAHALSGAAYLDRYGVLPTHAGRGLGKRLLHTWLRWGRRERLGYAWTYTLDSNAQSINALIACGLRAWRPDWARPGYCVWRRPL